MNLTKRQLIALIVCDVAIIAMAMGAWILMLTGKSYSYLAQGGIVSLRYFTVLSNMLMSVSCVICIVFSTRALKAGSAGSAGSGATYSIPRGVRLFRLISVNGVALTFLVVVFFLTPMVHSLKLFMGHNFFLHFAAPVTAIASQAVFKLSSGIRLSEAFLGLLPMLAYAAFYVGNILINGIGEGPIPFTNDWYNFCQGDVSRLPMVIVAMLVSCIAIAVLLWLISGGAERRRKAQ